MDTEIFDVVIIGCGCVGAFAAMYLAKYKLKIVVIESASEPSFGSTKANSGIVHSSHNTDEGTLKYYMVDEGNRRIRELSKLLNFGYKQCGEIVVAKSYEQIPALQRMFEKAQRAGLKAEMLTVDQLRAKEPNVKGEAAMFVPEAGVVNPYEMAIAVFNSAYKSGCKGLFNWKVAYIHYQNGLYKIVSEAGAYILSKFVINAAGLYADEIAKMVDPYSPITIVPRKGEEYLLDKDCAGIVNSIIFPLPDGKSKGILVIPTVDYTIMVGPTAVDVDDKQTKATSTEGMKKVFDTASQLVNGLNYNMVIASFTGIRAVDINGDFIVNCTNNFINLAGIQSPGMTASPVLGERAAYFVVEALKPYSNSNFSFAPLNIKFANGNKKQLVYQDGNHSRILCGCEMVTVADVNNAITDGARTVDGVKARTRAGMGRCYGGFCTNVVVDILSYRLRMPKEQIRKRDAGTELSLQPLDGPANHVHDIESVVEYKPLPLAEMRAKILSQDSDKVLKLLEYEYPHFEVVIVGGGPSGLAAGYAAASALPQDKVVLILEKSARTGGVLIQCIHAGFGLKRFEKELTGPEYAELLTNDTVNAHCHILLGAFVIGVDSCANDYYKLKTVIGAVGYKELTCNQLIVTNGCRERSRQNIKLAGTRPSGVYTAGMAQEMINLRGQLPGRNIVILGSGDIGLIMARRCTLEGAHVIGVYELLPRCSGLYRNVAQCLEDFDIPLHLSHTVVTVFGNDRVEAVEIAPVDSISLTPILEKKFTVVCDCLLLSVGLIPQAKMALYAGGKMSAQSRLLYVDSVRSISKNAFAAGNCLQVHDLADDAAVEGELAGKAAASSILYASTVEKPKYSVQGDSNVLFCVPDFVSGIGNETISLRVKYPLGRAVVIAFCNDKEIGRALVDEAVPAEMIHVPVMNASGPVKIYIERLPQEYNSAVQTRSRVLTCIVCPRGCKINVLLDYLGDIEDISGYSCPRGEAYARQEHVEPFRAFSTTIAIDDGEFERLPVKIGTPIAKSRLLEAARLIKQIKVAAPVKIGQVVGKVCGVSVLACCSVAKK